MAFKNGAYATVWEVKEGNGKFSDVRISTSRRNAQSGEYETDFSGYVRFIGEAHEKAGLLKEKDRIRLGDVSATNSYNKEKKITYTNFQVYSFEMADGASGTQNVATSNTKPPKREFKVEVEEGVDEELPFA